MIQDVDQDGRITGPDFNTFTKIISDYSLSLPVHIGSCGVTSWNHYIKTFELQSVDAVAVANVHHMSGEALRTLRSTCRMAGIDLRSA